MTSVKIDPIYSEPLVIGGAELDYVPIGTPRPAKKVQPIVGTPYSPSRFNDWPGDEGEGLPGSGILTIMDSEGCWQIVQVVNTVSEVLVTFSEGAEFTQVNKVAARLRRVWNEAYDTGFAEGMDEGWTDGYKSGRATFDPNEVLASSQE
jgi:hypothetical protein